ncbi:MAG: 1,6-anhydro-N-acetylmuramyl-L-alanine amidase AmpD [Oxalobacter sp.]|nr:1,6-anhydro-N-acetylmuramyl-L-alanine amidase AmpD [Oxalobacter sp.]
MTFTIDQEGWCQQARQIPSPNHNERPEGQPVELLVIHNISLPPGQFGGPYITDMFLNRLDYDVHPFFDQLRQLRVSSHFFIRRTGELIQFVPTEKRAWHAGASSFMGREGCNDFSVGIELEGTDFVPFEPTQYKILAALTKALAVRYPQMKNVAGHEHIAPVRKTDPGPFFDWAGYSQAMADNGINLVPWFGDTLPTC